MANIDWMNSLLNEGEPYMRYIFRVDEWLVASDGRFLCAVKCDEVLPEPFVDKFNTAKTVREMVSAALEVEEFDLAHLKAWSTRPEPPCGKCNGAKKVTCKTCHGTSEVGCICECGDEHSATCGDCVKGIAECACVEVSIPALVFGECVNLVILERAIRNFSGNFRVSKNAPHSSKPIILGGENWRAVVMPMKTEATETYEPQPAEAHAH